MTSLDYDEDEVLRSYLLRNSRQLWNEFEWRCVHYLDTLQEKAKDPVHSKGISRELWREWLADADEEVREALADGVVGFNERVQQRLLREYSRGTLAVNRCPACDRIVRTPQAKQCLWCSHDWHNT